MFKHTNHVYVCIYSILFIDTTMWKTRQKVEHFNFGCRREYTEKYKIDDVNEYRNKNQDEDIFFTRDVDGKLVCNLTTKLIDGDWKEFNRQGILTHHCVYDHGKPHGLEKAWHDNGQLWWQVEYIDGKREGKLEMWFPSGQKNASWTYKNNQLLGTYLAWNQQSDNIMTREY